MKKSATGHKVPAPALLTSIVFWFGNQAGQFNDLPPDEWLPYAWFRCQSNNGGGCRRRGHFTPAWFNDATIFYHALLPKSNKRKFCIFTKTLKKSNNLKILRIPLKPEFYNQGGRFQGFFCGGNFFLPPFRRHWQFEMNNFEKKISLEKKNFKNFSREGSFFQFLYIFSDFSRLLHNPPFSADLGLVWWWLWTVFWTVFAQSAPIRPKKPVKPTHLVVEMGHGGVLHAGA